MATCMGAEPQCAYNISHAQSTRKSQTRLESPDISIRGMGHLPASVVGSIVDIPAIV